MGGGMPYMQFGMDSLNSISQMLLSRKLKYDDTIIIGDNSSGKSLFLRLLIEKKKEKTYTKVNENEISRKRERKKRKCEGK